MNNDYREILADDTSNRFAVVQWSRFGPYHDARLLAAREQLGRTRAYEVLGLEIASSDQYDWARVSRIVHETRRTLFPDRNYVRLTHQQIVLAVWRFFRNLKPSVVAINGWGVPEAWAAVTWCRWKNIPCVLMSETMEERREGWQQRYKEFFKSVIVRRCDAALVGGRKQSEYLVKLGFPRDRIFLGYDAIDNDYFSNNCRLVRSDMGGRRRAHDLPARYFFVCTRFLARKNVDGLLRAYAQYRERCAGTPWDLVISGSGEEAGSLRELAAAVCPTGVHWPGFVQYDQLPVYYALASAFVHPALSEAWGLVVNEAAACGLPLLVGDSVGSRYELVRDGDNGFLFDASNDEDICRALCTVSALTDDERQAMGSRSEAIVAEWSPRRFGEQLLAAVEAAKQSRRSNHSAGKKVSELR